MPIDINHNTIHLKPGLQLISHAGAKLALDYQCVSETPTHLLMLVNGFQRSRLDFRAFRKKLENLAPHVATVAFDNRYSGETLVDASAAPLSMSLMAQDVSLIANIFTSKLGLKKYSLLGISMGGMIAQTVAVQETTSLEHLFLVSTTAGGAGRTWPQVVADPTQLKFTNHNISLADTEKNMSRYFAQRFLKNSPLLFAMMCKNIFKAAQEDSVQQNIGSQEQFRVSTQFDGVKSLKQVTAKTTLVITGDEDKIIPAENSHFLHQHISQSQLIVYPAVGHLILIEEPDKFIKDITAFF